jgi:hypothetical protein
MEKKKKEKGEPPPSIEAEKERVDGDGMLLSPARLGGSGSGGEGGRDARCLVATGPNDPLSCKPAGSGEAQGAVSGGLTKGKIATWAMEVDQAREEEGSDDGESVTGKSELGGSYRATLSQSQRKKIRLKRKEEGLKEPSMSGAQVGRDKRPAPTPSPGLTTRDPKRPRTFANAAADGATRELGLLVTQNNEMAGPLSGEQADEVGRFLDEEIVKYKLDSGIHIRVVGVGHFAGQRMRISPKDELSRKWIINTINEQLPAYKAWPREDLPYFMPYTTWVPKKRGDAATFYERLRNTYDMDERDVQLRGSRPKEGGTTVKLGLSPKAVARFSLDGMVMYVGAGAFELINWVERDAERVEARRRERGEDGRADDKGEGDNGPVSLKSKEGEATRGEGLADSASRGESTQGKGEEADSERSESRQGSTGSDSTSDEEDENKTPVPGRKGVEDQEMEERAPAPEPMEQETEDGT